MPVSVLRAGKTIEVALPVSREPDRLLRGYDGRLPVLLRLRPAGLLAGGLRRDLLLFPVQSRCWPAATARSRPGASDRARFPGEELVVVTAPLLRTRMTKGYADPFGQVVSEVNGTKVKNLATWSS